MIGENPEHCGVMETSEESVLRRRGQLTEFNVTGGSSQTRTKMDLAM